MSKRFALLGIFAMLALQILWHAFLLPPERVPLGVVLSIAILPIAPAVILALFRRPSAIFWGGVAALLYFCHSITELWTTPTIWPLALLELGLSLWIIFCGNWTGLQAKVFKRKKSESA
ncbi:MAG TPA: DUF2069 domain-containing protein [Arenimonas sp.]|nr:DUF2069 domain-containing protein [Arenimonas sp.]